MMPTTFNDDPDAVLDHACSGNGRGAALADLQTADLRYLRWRFGKNPAFRMAVSDILEARERTHHRRLEPPAPRFGSFL
jgi:hypothetical protein